MVPASCTTRPREVVIVADSVQSGPTVYVPVNVPGTTIPAMLLVSAPEKFPAPSAAKIPMWAAGKGGGGKPGICPVIVPSPKSAYLPLNVAKEQPSGAIFLAVPVATRKG